MKFTKNYPGPRRITLSGDVDRVAEIKAFGPDSVKDGVTPRQRRNHCVSGTRPALQIRLKRGADESRETFRARVRAECERMAKRFRARIWDMRWGFPQEIEEREMQDAEPFDDGINF